MASAINLILNRNNKRGVEYGLIRAADDPSPVLFPELVVGDSANFQLQISDGSSDGNLETLSSYSIRLGIGSIGELPTGGTWTITDGTDTTANLDYNASASTVQTALNALNTSTGPFGDTVTVSGAAGGPYKITFASNGAQSSLSVATDSLTPESGGTVSELVAGDGSNKEVQSIYLFQQPLILVTGWTISGTTATASVDLTDYDLYATVAAQSNKRLSTTIEIEVTDADGNRATLLQRSMTIRAEVLPNGAGAQSLNSDDYATETYVDNRVYRIKVDSGDASPDYITNKVANSVTVTAGDTIELDGDETSPGPLEAYSTDGSGNKGWQPMTAHMLYLYKHYG